MYLIGREFMLRLFYHSVNGVRDTERMQPVVVWHIAIVLPYGEDESHQAFGVKSRKHEDDAIFSDRRRTDRFAFEGFILARSRNM